jgi:putative flippase GtrA
VRQFFLFLLSGGAAAGLNWGSRFLFSLWMPFAWAVTAAFVVGLASGFLLMRLFVFDGRAKAVAPQAVKFLVINLLALGQTLLVSLVVTRWLASTSGEAGSAEAIGHLAGVLVPVVTSYFGHRLLTFR